MLSPKDEIKARDAIFIKGARVHNLKNIDVVIPRRKLVVITGVSGSGKSSLAFDTLYAEGQRRYVESLSAYVRQFTGRMNKPDVDYIHGISPAVAIEQKVNTRNPRSTVGTSTEIYDYLKLLFARTGKTFSPVSGNPVKSHSVEDVVDFICTQKNGTRFLILSPVTLNPTRPAEENIRWLIQKGYSRYYVDEKILMLEDFKKDNSSEKKPAKGKGKKEVGSSQKAVGKNETIHSLKIELVIDRISVSAEDDFKSRAADSVQTAFSESNGDCNVALMADDVSTSVRQRTDSPGRISVSSFSNRFELDGMTFEVPSVHLFSFNNPYGACKKCEGFGSVIGIDENLVVPDKSLSVYDGAIVCWHGEKMKEWNEALIKTAYKFDFPIHRPIYDLTTEEKKLLWTGNGYFQGLNSFFKYVEEQGYKIQYRVMLSRYRGKTICPDCNGTRLRKDATYVKVGGKSINEIVLLPVSDCLKFFKNIKLSQHESVISKRILTELTSRLTFLNDVGLGYLTLNRLSNTLSGGESQRINLATSLGSSLVGSLYILDEPSIGLHPRDTGRLITVLKTLRDLGNTVIVVEHDEEIIRQADVLIDMGPMAGVHGGEILFQGKVSELNGNDSLTAKYLSGKEEISVPLRRRRWNKYVKIEGARENNLKNISVKFPLGVMTVVSGVSGSGKSSLVKKVFYPAIKKITGGYSDESGSYDKISGDYNQVTAVEFVDQNPIGRSSRSNPVTFVKAYDEIRGTFSELAMSKSRKFKPSHFSFNVDGGRCEVCEGEGEVTIEMQFMADIHLTCETCNGKRFKQEILDVHYKGKSIADVLDMTVDEAIEFFKKPILSMGNEKKIVSKLQPLADVGLGYIKLGQSSSTLSGGEAQRVKLASFLRKDSEAHHTLFIFDEPTTGLHFHDIRKLLFAFDALLEHDNSLIIIEHNPEVIKYADWVIDLGPEGGEEGGHLVFEGKPEDLIQSEKSLTGKFLKNKFKAVKAEL
ncbi:MAG TPA: excinuclease ABC subunit UvrA [Bacteroidia bacterium]|nr:excinuclease ABC subunit UvrA [Bacteroidia bacterium]